MSKLKAEFGIESLITRRKRSLLRLMYIQSKAIVNIQEERNYMTMLNSGKVKMKSAFTKLTKIQRSPYYRGLKLWDTLPENVQKERSKSKFKNEISKCISLRHNFKLNIDCNELYVVHIVKEDGVKHHILCTIIILYSLHNGYIYTPT